MDQHNLPPNGSGGAAGTHEGHANVVPPSVPLGLGMDGSLNETEGNNASRQYRKEHDLRGAGPSGFMASLQTPLEQ